MLDFYQKQLAEWESKLDEALRERDVVASRIYACRRRIYVCRARVKRESLKALQEKPDPNYPGRKIGGQWLFPGDDGYDPSAPINPDVN